MKWFDVSWNPSSRTLRNFAGLCLLFAAGAAWREEFMQDRSAVAWVFLLALLGVGSAGLMWPQMIRPVWVIALAITVPVRWLVSWLMLCLLYYLVFAPLGIGLRLCGRDKLRLWSASPQDSYWEPRRTEQDLASYHRQF